MKKLILIDGNSLLYRAYYATAYSGSLMKSSKGLPTNALYAFSVMMLNILDNYQFSHILVAFDAGKTTFRHKDYKEYKGGRKPTPSELLQQIPISKQLLDVLNVKRYELELYEADDIIGTLSYLAQKSGFDEVEIISSDKDLLQLVTNTTHVNLTQKGLSEIESYTIEHLREVYGLSPRQITDLKGLMGDASDNIPGVPGIGQKTAIKLLTEFDSIENLLNHTDQLTGKVKEKIEENKALALLSKKIATIHMSAPIDITIEDTIYHQYDVNVLVDFFQSVDFHSLIKKINSTKTLVEKEENLVFTIVDSKFPIDTILLNDSFIIIETFGLNYHKNEILGLAIVNKIGRFFIPYDIMGQSLMVDMFLK